MLCAVIGGIPMFRRFDMVDTEFQPIGEWTAPAPVDGVTPTTVKSLFTTPGHTATVLALDGDDSL